MVPKNVLCTTIGVDICRTRQAQTAASAVFLSSPWGVNSSALRRSAAGATHSAEMELDRRDRIGLLSLDWLLERLDCLERSVEIL